MKADEGIAKKKALGDHRFRAPEQSPVWASTTAFDRASPLLPAVPMQCSCARLALSQRGCASRTAVSQPADHSSVRDV